MLTQSPPEPESIRFTVAPWFRDGYGGATGHATEEEAIAVAKDLTSRGYGEVHVTRVAVQMITRIKTETTES